MTRTKPAATLLAWTMTACLAHLSPSAAAQPPQLAGKAIATPPESRGEMLYSVSCGSCHATEVHWRAKKLATDADSLRREVLRWKTNVDAAWNDDDVNEVARYLDTAFYRFSAPAREEGATSRAGDSGSRLQPRKQGEISYISGGLRPEERRALRAVAGDYNLQLSFAHKRATTDFPGIRITIGKAKEAPLLDTMATGPLFLAQLPAGRYRLTIEQGAKRSTKLVAIGKGKPAVLHF